MKAEKIQNARWWYQAMTAGLVVVLFAVNAAVLLRPIVRPKNPWTTEQNTSSAELRGPASMIVPPSLESSPGDQATSSMKLDCQQGTDPSLIRSVAANVRQIRFDFRSCDVESVVNETNGSEATLFPSPTKVDSLVTDYVALSERENQIVIKSKSGSLRRITIQRKPTAVE